MEEDEEEKSGGGFKKGERGEDWIHCTLNSPI